MADQQEVGLREDFGGFLEGADEHLRGAGGAPMAPSYLLLRKHGQLISLHVTPVASTQTQWHAKH
jgi:hypothetical protein